MKPALAIRSADLVRPSLNELRDYLQPALSANYESSSVQIVECPDLREWGCPAAGICGRVKIVEVGGEPYLHNPKYRGTDFDLNEIAAQIDAAGDFVFGAWSPSLTALGGHSGEVVVSRRLGGKNSSLLARVGQHNDECIVEQYPHDLHGGLANFCCCAGEQGSVLKIEASVRIGDQASFTQVLRAALQQPAYAAAGAIALAGIFRIEDGAVKAHVQPDYEKIKHEYYDVQKERVVKDFLQFYAGMGPDLLCYSVLWAGTPAGEQLNLRPNGEHTHFCSTSGKSEAGHYHNDTAAQTISYCGYFNSSDKLFRVNDIYTEIGCSRI